MLASNEAVGLEIDAEKINIYWRLVTRLQEKIPLYV
jgi:hypothetical protein